MFESVKLGLLDAVILIAYLVIVAIIGFVVARREKKTTEDYFLAGFNIPWYAIGLSMVASSISTEQFIGEVGMAYTYGLAVANWEWLNFIALSVLIWIFIPFYIRGKVTTMPEFLERRYGRAPRAIFAWLTVITYTIVNLPLVLYGGRRGVGGHFRRAQVCRGFRHIRLAGSDSSRLSHRGLHRLRRAVERGLDRRVPVRVAFDRRAVDLSSLGCTMSAGRRFAPPATAPT